MLLKIRPYICLATIFNIILCGRRKFSNFYKILNYLCITKSLDIADMLLITIKYILRCNISKISGISLRIRRIHGFIFISQVIIYRPMRCKSIPTSKKAIYLREHYVFYFNKQINQHLLCYIWFGQSIYTLSIPSD